MRLGRLRKVPRQVGLGKRTLVTIPRLEASVRARCFNLANTDTPATATGSTGHTDTAPIMVDTPTAATPYGYAGYVHPYYG